MLIYTTELDLDDYAVSCQGARVEHVRTGKILHHSTLPQADVAPLVAEGMARGFTVMLWLYDAVYAQADSPFLDAYREETRDVPVKLADLATLVDQPTEKVIWAGEPSAVISSLREFRMTHGDRMSLTITTDWSLEFTGLKANKNDGVAALAKHLGISADAILAFGDGNNDVPLLSWAGFGVAMPHGRAAAHAAANLVAPAGDPESAFARAVELITANFAMSEVA
jgi:hydroxymethylpyrimidine pyrophosphatase-like HAD family hydrolase